ncbi:hypothetical protein D7O18_26895 [Salmonella enterica subsp. enterica serovar Muenchen]|nr:hypothetical protein [Salmonella enterica subsp. enterica serovar Muenchen]
MADNSMTSTTGYGQVNMTGSEVNDYFACQAPSFIGLLSMHCSKKNKTESIKEKPLFSEKESLSFK